MGSLGLIELLVIGALVSVAVVSVWRLYFRSGSVQASVMLRRWGIGEPTREQSEAAADYLHERRRLYPFVLVALGVVLVVAYRLVGEPLVGNLAVLLGAFLGTLLVAELVAALRRPASTARVATLVPRRLADLVPPTWLTISAALFVVAVACVVPALGMQAWSDEVHAWAERNPAQVDADGVLTSETLHSLPRGSGAIWLSLALLVLVAVSTAAVVRLTLTRAPLAADAAVDSALRIRTARVAVATAVLLVFVLAVALTARVIGAVDPTGWGDPTAAAPDFPVLAPWLVTAGSVVKTIYGLYGLVAFVCYCGLISPWRRQRLVEATR